MKKISVLALVFLMTTVTAVEAVTDNEGTNLQTTVQDTITIDCDGSDGQDTVDLGSLTAGTPVTGSTACVVIPFSTNLLTLLQYPIITS